ncbi:MAG: hypothetical protein ACJ71S_06525 [Acidobacteriaceae bacterium]|jgi:hypothetical protein
MSVADRFPNFSNGGETTSFYSCRTCGASVQRGDRARHDEWHRELEKLTSSLAVYGPI